MSIRQEFDDQFDKMDITGTTGLLALLGSPVAHSRSPQMYNLCFAARRQDFVYVAFDVNKEQMPGALDAFRLFGIRGGNVTMPGKSVAAGLMDHLSEAAELCGAVNTIVNVDGALWGHNTDGVGFVQNLKDHGESVERRKLTLVGAGGAATAILVQCALDGAAELSVFSRPGDNYSRIAKVIQDLNTRVDGCKIRQFDLSDSTLLHSEIADSDFLVNATSLGMSPRSDTSIVDDTACLHKELVVCDIVYNPTVTKLMKDATAGGVRAIIGGAGMLLFQGAEAYRLFTGTAMPIDLVKRTVYKDLYPGVD